MRNPDKTLKTKQVFNYIFEKSREAGEELTPMKAIKLVYFAHAWYLGFESRPLIEEPIQAWQFGAVIPSLYQSLKVYGSGVIQCPIPYDPDKYFLNIYLGEFDKIPEKEYVPTGDLADPEKRMIDMVWNSYKRFTAIELSNMIHMKGTPWSQIWNDGNCPRSAIIPNEKIEEYYKKKILETTTPKQ